MDINLEYIKALALNHEGVDVEFKETTGQLNRGHGDSLRYGKR